MTLSLWLLVPPYLAVAWLCLRYVGLALSERHRDAVESRHDDRLRSLEQWRLDSDGQTRYKIDLAMKAHLGEGGDDERFRQHVTREQAREIAAEELDAKLRSMLDGGARRKTTFGSLARGEGFAWCGRSMVKSGHDRATDANGAEVHFDPAREVDK